MRYVLGVLAALAIGWGHCAPADATELFPLQAVSAASQSIASVTQYTSSSTFSANTANAPLTPAVSVVMNPPAPAFSGSLSITGINSSSAVIWGYINEDNTATAGTGFTQRITDPTYGGDTEDAFQSSAASITVPWTASSSASGAMMAAAALKAPSLSHTQSIAQGPTAGSTSSTTAAFTAIGTGHALVGVINECCTAGVSVTNIQDNAVPPNTYPILGSAEYSSGISDYETLFALANIHGNPTTLTFTFSGATAGLGLHMDEYSGVTAIDNASIVSYTSSTAANPSVTLNRSSGNVCGFHLVGVTVEAGASGCAAGTYSDWNVVATQAGTINGSLTQPESATAIGGGSGCLPGSFCPSGPGIGAWINDMDEHFTGNSLPSNWAEGDNNFLGAGGESNCQEGVLVFNHPGVTLYGLPYDFTNNRVNGCAIWTPPSVYQGLSTPGYFETNMIVDSQGTWTGVFFEFGTMSGCYPPSGPDIAQGGAEVDLVETLVGGNGLIWDGYTTCTVLDQPHTGDGNSGAHHVWGVDYGDNGAITYYEDGMVTFQYAPTDGVEPPAGCRPADIRCTQATGQWEGEMIFMDFICLQNPCTNTNTGGTKIIWARHYHH